MPWYSFAVHWPDGRPCDARASILADHEAARRYAHLVIRELKERLGYSVPELKMIVKDGNGDVIHVIPF